MNKGLLNTIGVLNLIFGILFTLTILGSIIGIPLIVSGAIYLNYASLNDSELIKKRSTIKTWSIVFIFTNIISAILSFLFLVDMEKYEKGSDYDPSTLRLNFLLNLGMGLILLSGIIVANTSWNSILDYVKVIILLLFGVIFIFLSYILGKRKNLKYTSNSYWFIGFILISLSIYSVGYFGLLGEYFSLNGDGRNLFIAILSLVSTIILFLAYRKFNTKFFSRLAYIGFFITIIYLISHFVDSMELFSIIFLGVLTLINLFVRGKSDIIREGRICANIVTYFWFLIIFILNIVTSDTLLMLINNVIYIANLITISLIDKYKANNVFIIIIIPILVLLYCYKFLSFDIAVISSSIAIFAYFIGTYIFKKEAYIFIPGLIISNILLFVNYIISYFSCYTFLPVITSCLLIGIFIPLTFVKDYEKKYLGELIIQPIKALLLCIAACFLIASTQYKIGFMSYIVVWSNVMLIFSILNKNKILKNVYFIISYFLLFLTIIPINMNIFFRINSVIMWILGFVIPTLFDKENWLNKANYVFYFFSLVSLFTLFSYINFSVQLALLNIIIFALCAYIFKSSKPKCFTALIFILLPYYSLINILDINTSILHILRFIPYIFYTYLFTNTITKKYSTLNLILEITISLLVFIILIFEGSIEVTVFVGIISILMIILDALFKYNSLFIVGLTTLILNILFNLITYWSVIPVWIYLLIGGVILITIITVQEVRKNK